MQKRVTQHSGVLLRTAAACICFALVLAGCTAGQDRSAAASSATVLETSASAVQETEAETSFDSAGTEEDGAAAGAVSSNATAAGVAQSSAAATPSFDADIYRRNESLDFGDIPSERVVDAQACMDLKEDPNTIVRVVDVRDTATFKDGSIEGAVCIPAGWQVVSRFEELGKKATIVLVDQQNERVAAVRQTLIDLGVSEERVFVLNGGIDAWVAAGFPLQENQDISCC